MCGGFSYQDFHVGMTVVGRVTAINDKGVFIDIGCREAPGKTRDARANPAKLGALAIGQRVLARITRLLENRRLIPVEILEPQLS